MGRKGNRTTPHGRAGLERIDGTAKGKTSPSEKAKSRPRKRIARSQTVVGQELRRERAASGDDSTVSLVMLDADALKTPSIGFWLLALTATFVFSFWTTLGWLESQWRNEPDYSHGYLVIPLAAMLLYIRRDTFPGVTARIDLRGCSLLLLAVCMRVGGRFGYMDFLDGWAIVPFVGGITWLTLGLPAARWAAPGIIFLFMLVPMPFRFETMLSWKLQGLATSLSTATLRICGLPAIAEGHIIWIDDTELMIEKACSGLRIFMGMIALAFFWAATVRRSWLDRFMIMLAAIPLAILTNSARISITAILYGYFPAESARRAIHDWSGFLMIPTAALLLWLFKYFWECLYRPVQLSNAGHRLKSRVKHTETLEDDKTDLQLPSSQS